MFRLRALTRWQPIHERAGRVKHRGQELRLCVAH
jgi:hypothetical protein